MGYKMKGSPAKLGTIQGTAGHSSALKMKAEADAASALKQMELTKEDMKGSGYTLGKGKDSLTVSATGKTYTSTHETKGGVRSKRAKPVEITLDKNKPADKAILSSRWKKGDKASGGTLNELVAARKKHKKGSAEYAAIQNKINKSLGSKKVHTATKTTKSGETKVVKPKGTKEVGEKTVMKGVEADKGKTVEFTRKVAEKERISKERKDIKKAKKSGDKVEKFQSQKEISEIKSGRDDKYTGTKLSRYLHKRRAKRKAKKEAKAIEKAKNA
tara:strand:+ start:318 stop:1133 length:816 start_codon:yes stop_codon:yes gene_type:complete